MGTSGFSYPEWKPEFYPADLKPAGFLGYYATRFPSVVINATFYRAPNERTLRTWGEQTPDDFRFTLKAPQRITHVQRLRDADEILGYFLATARALGSRLGAILFQCPPSLRRDDELLGKFLAALPGEPFRFAMEFRHASWDTPEVRETLGANGVALCVAETEEGTAPMVRTAQGFVYLRLRGLGYTEEQLGEWARRTQAVLADGADAFVYFKHEDDPSGVRFGLRFKELVDGA